MPSPAPSVPGRIERPILNSFRNEKSRGGEATCRTTQVRDWILGQDNLLFEVVACGTDAPAEAEVAAFEAECGFTLPSEFGELLARELEARTFRRRTRARR